MTGNAFFPFAEISAYALVFVVTSVVLAVARWTISIIRDPAPVESSASPPRWIGAVAYDGLTYDLESYQRDEKAARLDMWTQFQRMVPDPFDIDRVQDVWWGRPGEALPLSWPGEDLAL